MNGRSDRTARATNAQLWIDGLEILAPTDFGGDAAIVERPVTLAGEHRLAVRFAGQPSSEILIIIESKNWMMTVGRSVATVRRLCPATDD